jgi:hypothetical protein
MALLQFLFGRGRTEAKLREAEFSSALEEARKSNDEIGSLRDQLRSVQKSTRAAAHVDMPIPVFDSDPPTEMDPMPEPTLKLISSRELGGEYGREAVVRKR